MFSYSSNRHKKTKAFGLIELMVSMGIMALVAGVMVSRQSSFNGAILLRNQTYEIAYALREVQLLAVSGGDETVRQYGIHFDTATANERIYVMFADSNSNGSFDSGEQIGLTGRLDSRFEIRDLSLGGGGENELDITFRRPNFDALFCVRVGGCTTSSNYGNGPAYVNIARKDQTGQNTGVVRRVQITETGQISVITY